MALTSSQKARILSLIGNAIVDYQFRGRFFTEPEAACLAYYSDLTSDELAQLRALGTHPRKASIQDNMAKLRSDFGCPVYPCPETLDPEIPQS